MISVRTLDDGTLRYHTGFGAGIAAILGVSLAPPVLIAAFDPRARTVLLLTTAGVVLLMYVLYRTTHYTFGDSALHVRCGPITVDAPYDAIRRAAPSSSLMSGYAMSLDRIEIEYGDGATMLISPADREGFLAELRRRARHADIRNHE
ncbi:MAG: PH domain-containing protein [Gemmatimonadaceae bacterium]|nr:PH domain-containing protein [Gemmatimonadaceae bacterium]